MALSFVNDIRQPFRGTPMWKRRSGSGSITPRYEQVEEKAQKIYSAVDDESMPCDELCSKGEVAWFKPWMDESMAAPEFYDYDRNLKPDSGVFTPALLAVICSSFFPSLDSESHPTMGITAVNYQRLRPFG